MLTSDKAEELIIKSISNDILEYTIQFFRTGKQSRPQSMGSGVLLRLGSKHFLLTAAHIADEYDDVYLLIGHEASSIGGITRTYPLPASGEREDDKIDVSICELDNDTIEYINRRHRFLEFTDLLLDHKPIYHPIYLIVGFPSTKTKVIFGTRRMEPIAITLLTKPFPNLQYDQFGFDPIITLPFEFNGLVTSTDNPSPHLAPRLEGISGGGVWQITQISPYPRINRKLVGILIERNNQPGQKALISIKIDFITEYLRQVCYVNIPKSSSINVSFEKSLTDSEYTTT